MTDHHRPDPTDQPTDRRSEQGVDFAPTRIGDDRRRRIDPVAIVAAVLVLGLGAAVLKPWETSAPAGQANATVPPASVAPGPATTAPPPAAAPLDRPVAAMVAAALEVAPVRRERGIQLFVDGAPRDAPAETPADASLVERWMGTAGGIDTVAAITVDRPVRGLGVTAGPGEAVLDVRVWQDAGAYGWRWLDAAVVDVGRSAAEHVLLPPSVDGTPLAAWPAGRYRLDVLMGGWMDHLEVVLDVPATEPDPPGRPAPRAPPEPPEPPRTLADVSVMQAYAVVDDAVRPLTARPGPLLDQTAAWVDPTGVVARVPPGRVTTLGVALPPSAADVEAAIRHLAPAPTRGDDAEYILTAGEGSGASTVGWSRADGRPLTPGVYALDLAWEDDEGAHSAAWHVELRPAGAERPLPLLDAARRYAPFADALQLIVSRPWRLGMEAGSQAVATFDLDATHDCAATRMGEPPVVVGLGVPKGASVVDVTSYRQRPLGGRETIGVRVVRDAVPGLVLVVPRDAGRFRPVTHEFRVTLEQDGAESIYGITICLGT